MILASTGRDDRLPADRRPGHDLGPARHGSPVTGPRRRVADHVVGLGGRRPVRPSRARWRLPVIGADPMPAGVSANGRTIVLVPADAAGTEPGAGPTSRFAILQRAFADGSGHRHPAGRLRVRRHLARRLGAVCHRASRRAARGALPGPRRGCRDGPAARGRRGRQEPTSTRPWVAIRSRQLRRPDGMVFTLYRGAEHPFIHALSTLDAWAVCIDLPATGDDDAPRPSTGGWRSARRQDHGRRQRDARDRPRGSRMTDLRARARRSFAPTAAQGGGIALAKFGHQAPGHDRSSGGHRHGRRRVRRPAADGVVRMASTRPGRGAAGISTGPPSRPSPWCRMAGPCTPSTARRRDREGRHGQLAVWSAASPATGTTGWSPSFPGRSTASQARLRKRCQRSGRRDGMSRSNGECPHVQVPAPPRHRRRRHRGRHRRLHRLRPGPARRQCRGADPPDRVQHARRQQRPGRQHGGGHEREHGSRDDLRRIRGRARGPSPPTASPAIASASSWPTCRPRATRSAGPTRSRARSRSSRRGSTTTLTAGALTVDTTSITSDKSQRDNRHARRRAPDRPVPDRDVHPDQAGRDPGRGPGRDARRTSR